MKTNVLQEEWQPVVGYEGLYEVSSFGRVKNAKRGKIMTPQKDRYGYLTIGLSRKKRSFFFLHRLVAEAFIPNPQNLPEVNHKDEVKTNNTVWNLEWCDCRYNINYGTAVERRRKRVRQYKDGVLVAQYGSVTEAAKKLSRSISYISNLCRKKIRNDYEWEYA